MKLIHISEGLRMFRCPTMSRSGRRPRDTFDRRLQCCCGHAGLTVEELGMTYHYAVPKWQRHRSASRQRSFRALQEDWQHRNVRSGLQYPTDSRFELLNLPGFPPRTLGEDDDVSSLIYPPKDLLDGIATLVNSVDPDWPKQPIHHFEEPSRFGEVITRGNRIGVLGLFEGEDRIEKKCVQMAVVVGRYDELAQSREVFLPFDGDTEEDPE